MKRIIPICLSISIIFMLLFTTGVYAESDRVSNNIHLLEGIFGQLIPTIQQWIH